MRTWAVVLMAGAFEEVLVETGLLLRAGAPYDFQGSTIAFVSYRAVAGCFKAFFEALEGGLEVHAP